jgi:hypothetical protein
MLKEILPRQSHREIEGDATYGGMAVKRRIPMEKMGQGKLDIPQVLHDLGEHSISIVRDSRHTVCQRKAAIYCGCYLLIAVGHPCEALIIGIRRHAGTPHVGWAMKLCGIICKIRAVALDTPSAPVIIFHRQTLGIVYAQL